MKFNFTELSGDALHYAFALAVGVFVPRPEYGGDMGRWEAVFSERYNNDNWANVGKYIEQYDISIIRIHDEYVERAGEFHDDGDSRYEWKPSWGATMHSKYQLEENYGSQGDQYSVCYHVDGDTVVVGRTPVEAVMRCIVLNILGEWVDIPEKAKKYWRVS